MTVITASIMDVRSISSVTFQQWGNNTNKIVTDITSINSDLNAVTANVVTLSTSLSSLSANVNTVKSQIVTINNTLSSNNLTGITNLSGTGIVSRTGNGTFSSRTITAPAAGLTISNGGGVAGNPTIALANDLAALEALASTGIAVRTTADTWAQRTITGPATGIQVTNGDGVSGNPTIALANDLNALESLASTGIAVRTAADTWAQRAITSSGAGLSVSNGDGVSGNPAVSLANDVGAIEALNSTGFPVRTTTDTWAQRAITVTAPLGITNGDGVLGNPAITVSAASTAATGVVELATTAETTTGTDGTRAVTPAGLAGSIGTTIQGFDAATVKSNVTKNMTVGYTVTTPDLGTTTTGTWTPNMASGNFVLMRNGGTFTIAPPANDGSMVVYFYNSAPGAITFSGWHKVTGDTLNTVVGNAFFLFITSIGGVKHCHIQKVLG
jgi:hypothetical protein